MTGPAPSDFTNDTEGWESSGLTFHALIGSTLQSFVFNNQGQADVVTLTDATLGTIVGTVAVPASTPTFNPIVSWPLVGGHTYQLTGAAANNGRFAVSSSFPAVDAQISVDASLGVEEVMGSTFETLSTIWFSFTSLQTC